KKVGQLLKIVSNRREPTSHTERPWINGIRDQDLPQTNLRRPRNTLRDQRERQDSLRSRLRDARRTGEAELDQGKTRTPGHLRVQPTEVCRRRSEERRVGKEG